MKDNAKADNFRNEGNVSYRHKKFYEALILYNKSLCHAMPQSSQLGLAYANRSAVYLKLKQFDKCLDNIQLARDNKYPNEAKLKEREEKCKEELKTQQPDMKNDPWTYFKLSYPANEKIPFIVDCLELRTDEKFGRHIVTNRNLSPGDVIAIEKPIFHSLHKSAWYSRCTFCLKSNMLNLIPCSDASDCSSSMYCDQECLTKARDRYGGANFLKIEPKLAGHSEESINAWTAVNKRLLELMLILKKYPNLVILKDLLSSNKQKTIFDYDLSNQTDDPATDFKLLSIFNNLEMDSNKHEESAFRLISSELVQYLLMTSGINFREFESLLVDYSTRLALIARRNGVTIFCRDQQDGKAILPFGDLCSHSCDPSIQQVIIDNKFVHIVVKPIKKGEQIFMNYGFDFRDIPDRIERQKSIFESYGFECSCAACVNNWSEMSFPRYDPSFVYLPMDDKNLPDTIEDSMIELRKHGKYIKDNFGKHPSLELNHSVKRYTNLLLSIEIKSMWPFDV